MPRWLRGFLLLTGGAGIGLTAFLTWIHLWGSLEGICRARGGCRVVLSSTYSHYEGIPTATYGLVFYFVVFLAVLSAPWLKSSLRAGVYRGCLILSVLAAGISVHLTHYSITALNTTCFYCLASLGLVLVMTAGLGYHVLRSTAGSPSSQEV